MKKIIVWFRQDLRRADNPALHYAYEESAHILPVYILDDENAGDWKRGAASRWWLHHSLKQFDKDLSGHLAFFKGKADDILPKLAKEISADAVVWNRCYEPWRIKRDKDIKSTLEDDGIEAKSFKGMLIWEPWTIETKTGGPYKVFTPFYKNGCLGSGELADPLQAPERLTYLDKPSGVCTLDELSLLPDDVRWDQKMEQHWTIGENGAWDALMDFIDAGASSYDEDRNIPDKDNTSRLSPHLHNGEISPRQIWHEIRKRQNAGALPDKHVKTYLSEIGWREFSYNLLYHFKERITDKPLMEKFEAFPWDKNKEALERWQKGQTGYPIVDAGMRQLWEEGWMHNRVRMIVGSFLVKHLLLHWSEGEKWFWDTLVDADLASNSASWQWIAGCGADAAPYFRIFNPITQGEKFDPNGDYTRKWVPELKDMPTKYLFKPWEADAETLKKAGVELGETYPDPIVDHSEAREKALSAYDKVKKAG